MRIERLARFLVLLAFLAGPFGLLALDHADFHCSGCPGEDSSSAGAATDSGPCPVCHAARTAGIAAPGPATFAQPLLLAVHYPAPSEIGFVSDAAPSSYGPRAPPALS